MTPTSPGNLGNDGGKRARAIHRVALVAIATNSALIIGQICIGLFAHAFSLVADAAHTLSDLITDLMVLVAGRRGADPADIDHPYGHGRIETASSLLLGGVLIAVGFGFLWASGVRLQNMDAQTAAVLHPVALVMAAVTLAAKEILFRFTLTASRRLSAPLLEANAWHARSDAASSLVVAIGIGGSLAGYPFLEPLAAAVVGFLILSMGLRLGWQAVRELIDTGLPPEELASLRQSIAATPGVVGLHDMRTRRMADRVLCDTHIQVDPRITVSEGHYIAERVSLAICKSHPKVSEVLVHVDTERDESPPSPNIEQLPDREMVRADIEALLGGDGPAIQRLLVHYLGCRIEVEVYFSPEAMLRAWNDNALQARTQAWLATQACYQGITYYVQIAP